MPSTWRNFRDFAPVGPGLTGAILTILFGLDRGRRRRGETGFFSRPWLALARVVIPLALSGICTVVMGQPWTADDLRQALALSLLITVASLMATLVIGIPIQTHGTCRHHPPAILRQAVGHTHPSSGLGGTQRGQSLQRDLGYR